MYECLIKEPKAMASMHSWGGALEEWAMSYMSGDLNHSLKGLYYSMEFIGKLLENCPEVAKKGNFDDMKKMGKLMENVDTQLFEQHYAGNKSKWTFNHKDITEGIHKAGDAYMAQNFPAAGYEFAVALDKAL